MESVASAAPRNRTVVEANRRLWRCDAFLAVLSKADASRVILEYLASACLLHAIVPMPEGARPSSHICPLMRTTLFQDPT